jgi:hypothetical protein
MSQIHPIVRYLIVCEDVRRSPNKPNPITLEGLFGTIRLGAQPTFPLLYQHFCVFTQLTECRGSAKMRIEIQHADSAEVIFRTHTQKISFPNDPLQVVAAIFRIRECNFSEPGLYWVQLWYNEVVIAQQPLLLR